MKPFILSLSKKKHAVESVFEVFFAFPHRVVLLGPLMVNSLSRA